MLLVKLTGALNGSNLVNFINCYLDQDVDAYAEI